MHTAFKKALLILGLIVFFFSITTTLTTRGLDVQSVGDGYDGYSMLIDGAIVDSEQNETDDNKVVITKSVTHNFVLLDPICNPFSHTLYKGPAILQPTRPPNA